MMDMQANQFCRHNLFTLNSVMVKLNDLWLRRYDSLRYLLSLHCYPKLLGSNPTSSQLMADSHIQDDIWSQAVLWRAIWKEKYFKKPEANNTEMNI
jgi:hypothetical protein